EHVFLLRNVLLDFLERRAIMASGSGLYRMAAIVIRLSIIIREYQTRGWQLHLLPHFPLPHPLQEQREEIKKPAKEKKQQQKQQASKIRLFRREEKILRGIF